MKKLVCAEPGRFEYMEAEIPVAKAGESLLKIRRIGICGTDLHAFDGTQPYFLYPRVLGHELAADYIAGDAEGFKTGDRVTIIPYFTAGTDVAARMGKPNCSADLQVFGVHIDGGMAEYAVVPSAALVHADGLGYDEMALIEPLAIGAHAIRRAAVIPEEFALVIGAGPIGLGVMQFAQLAGAKVIAMDVNQGRLDVALNQLHVWQTINAREDDVQTKLLELTGGDMPALIVDATGNMAAINQAFSYMAHGGRYVLVGLQKNNIAFSHPEFHKREGTLMSSRNATQEDFQQVIASLKAGKIDPELYITKRVGFDQVKEAFTTLLDPASLNIKCLITF